MTLLITTVWLKGNSLLPKTFYSEGTMKLEIYHKELTTASLCYNNNKIVVDAINGLCNWSISELPRTIQIEFHPFKIVPKLWIDGFLLNFWIADVQQEDHRLVIPIGDDFFERYKNKENRGRVDSLGENPDPIVMDKIVGRNFHKKLVDNIKLKLNEKSSLN